MQKVQFLIYFHHCSLKYCIWLVGQVQWMTKTSQSVTIRVMPDCTPHPGLGIIGAVVNTEWFTLVKIKKKHLKNMCVEQEYALLWLHSGEFIAWIPSSYPHIYTNYDLSTKEDWYDVGSIWRGSIWIHRWSKVRVKFNSLRCIYVSRLVSWFGLHGPGP